ncbi:hypothetical protein ACFVKB_40355 [Rhodococcus sp. NPDC127530]|uniref:hypothetical protein n=1 Tax=unclassified Rhodococcus (in: high G+C Gram-positive bacteria) TaxID=192944 RepID=UPI003637D94C
MSYSARPSARRSRSALILGLLALDFVIGLAPPLHWLAGNGTAVVSIGYFLAAGVFITLSLFVMTTLDGGSGGDR